MPKCVLIATILALLVVQSSAVISVIPTTTLTSETANNTSASDYFVTSTNGNAGAGNVSKESIRKLLPTGNGTKVYAHFMPWFDRQHHIDVGYESADRAQVKRQVDDMLSRGIDGAIIDWYGPEKTHHNLTAVYMRDDAETRGGKFQFAIVEDQGALGDCLATVGCDVTQKLINDLNYINSTFASSSAYMRVDGRPVIFSFDLEGVSTIDWTRVNSSIQGSPMLIFRNNSGFTRPYTSGSYAWTVVNKLNPDDWAQKYLDSFYVTSKSYPSMMTLAGAWKGFDDRIAAWSKNRVMNQNCGQVWLSTFSEMNTYLSAGYPMSGVQIVTWNDYEEGSSIESGIENCVSVSGSVTGTDLAWSITGQENTVDHFVVFVSTDGENLMPLAEVPVGVSGLSLAPFKLQPGNYTLYVKAIGKPSLTNKMSAGIPFTMPNVPPVATLNVSVQSGTAPVTLSASTVGSSDSDGEIVSRQIDFGDGTVSNSSWATHTYQAPGTYTVKATVIDNNGASNSAVASVQVKANLPPVAMIAITPATGIAPVTVTASTAGSLDSDGVIAGTVIDFGDGTTAQGATASHTYSAAGVYVVKATVTDNGGLSASASTSVSIAAPIPFALKVASPIDGSTTNAQVRFAASATSPVPVTAIKIYVDNIAVYAVNGSSLDTVLSLVPGSRYVVVQAWNQQGQITKTALRINVVNATPVAKLSVSPMSGTGPLTVTASTSGSSDPDGTITSTVIDFGDGYAVSATSASHLYGTAGVYTVSARVTDNNGGTASTKAPVTVSGVAIFSPTSNTTWGTSVRVLARAYAISAITSIKVYVDGRLSYGRTAASVDTYLNMTPGYHTVVVQAWDENGKVYRASSAITVR